MTNLNENQKPIWHWREAIAESAMSTSAKCLGFVFSIDMSDTGKFCQRSHVELMRLASLKSKRTFSRAADEMAEAGFLVIERGRRDAFGRALQNRYRPKFPKWAVLDDRPAETFDEPSPDPGSEFEPGEENFAFGSDPGSNFAHPGSNFELTYKKPSNLTFPDVDVVLREDGPISASTASRPSRKSAGRLHRASREDASQVERNPDLPSFIARKVLADLAKGCAEWHRDAIPFDMIDARNLARGALAALEDIDPQRHRAAFKLALIRLLEMKGRGVEPFGGAPYFRKVLTSEAYRLEAQAECMRSETDAAAFQAAAKAQAELETHAQIQKRRLEANDAACAAAERQAAKQAAKGPRPLGVDEIHQAAREFVELTYEEGWTDENERVFQELVMPWALHYSAHRDFSRIHRGDWAAKLCIGLHQLNDESLAALMHWGLWDKGAGLPDLDAVFEQGKHLLRKQAGAADQDQQAA